MNQYQQSEESLMQKIDYLTEKALEVVYNPTEHTQSEYDAVMFALGLMVERMYTRDLENKHKTLVYRQLKVLRTKKAS